MRPGKPVIRDAYIYVVADTMVNCAGCRHRYASTAVDDLHSTCAGGHPAAGLHPFVIMQGKNIISFGIGLNPEEAFL
jgi:hypothetical protein